MGANALYTKRTRHGHLLVEAVSALQKAIRRSQEEQALYWAAEIDLAGYGGWCFDRLLIMASEDIGPADFACATDILALHTTWNYYKKKRKTSEKLFIAQAVIRLSRAPKSRISDHACCLFWRDADANDIKYEIPDYALDEHTRRGKSMKRGWKHFTEVASVLVGEPDDLPDPYRDRFLIGCAANGNPDNSDPDLWLDGVKDDGIAPEQKTLL